MKIRNGFVSNSSSSSFIIAVDNKKDKRNFLADVSDINMSDEELEDSEGQSRVIYDNIIDVIGSLEEYITVKGYPDLIKLIQEQYSNKEKWTVAKIEVNINNNKLCAKLNRLENKKVFITLKDGV